MTESAFFQDLAMLMSVVGVIAVVFARLGWPKVLGYIFAGILMSEHTWGGSFLADVSSTRTIGQLGIVFLMFGMGLSFSAKDMGRIKSVALPAAVIDTVVMIWLGYTIGTRVFGWTPVPSVFLGVAICDSATTLLAKVIDEMGWAQRPFSKYVLGTSICEDIICVGAIAVATGFAHGGVSANTLTSSLGWLVVFFLTVLVFGFIMVPRLLTSVAKRDDDESLLLAILGCCFFVSYWAYKFDFSLALGAFLVGIVASSSSVSNRIVALSNPLKSMFSAVFFVSIGLLVDPMALWQWMPQILVVSVVVVFGKMLNVFFASILAGVDVKTAVQNGFSLAQIGEFAFMVAILYVGIVKDADVPLFQITIGASLVTTLMNPAMIRLSDRVGDVVSKKIPPGLQKWMEVYHSWIEKIRYSDQTPEYILLRSACIKLGIYAVLMLSVSVACAMLSRYDYSRFSVFFESHDGLFFFIISNIFAVSLLPMIILSARTVGDEIASLLVNGEASKWQVQIRYVIRFVVLVAIIIAFFTEWTMINIAVAPAGGVAQWFMVLVIAVTGVFGWRFFQKAGSRATQRFHESLTADEKREGLMRMMTVTMPEGIVHHLEIGANSPAIGGTVVTLNIRAKTGASIVSVCRGKVIHRNIGPEWEFHIGDVLIALGDQRQIGALKDLLGIVE